MIEELDQDYHRRRNYHHHNYSKMRKSLKRCNSCSRSRIKSENIVDDDNHLVRLCRQKDWRNVIKRCQSHPNEAFPIRLLIRSNNNNNFQQQRVRCRKHPYYNNGQYDLIGQPQHNTHTETPTGSFSAGKTPSIVNVPMDSTSDVLSTSSSSPLLTRELPAIPTTTTPVIYKDTALGLACAAWDQYSSSGKNGTAGNYGDNNNDDDDCNDLNRDIQMNPFTTATRKQSSRVMKTRNSRTDMMEQQILFEVIKTLVQICPQQIQCSQNFPGHTPLRDVVRNIYCTPKLLEVLLQQDVAFAVAVAAARKPATNDQDHLHNNNYSNKLLLEINPPPSTIIPAIHQQDRDGLYPIDHLVINIVQQAKNYHRRNRKITPNDQTDLLKTYVQWMQLLSSSSLSGTFSASPLIHLFSVGNSCCTSSIFECAMLLLQVDLSLILKCSKSTACTPLHIALRYFGNCKKLIEQLIEHEYNYCCRSSFLYSNNSMDNSNGDNKNTSDSSCCYVSMRHLNFFGDLPLHVACSVGVPLDVLCLVLEKTLIALPPPQQQQGDQQYDDSIHPLIWTENYSGYTPLDLEWIRHIENGNNALHTTTRTFYPLVSPRPVNDRTQQQTHIRTKQNGLYLELLQQAVDQVLFAMDSDDDEKHMTKAIGKNNDKSLGRNKVQQQQITQTISNTFGSFLHRTFLIMNAAIMRGIIFTEPERGGAEITSLTEQCFSSTTPSSSLFPQISSNVSSHYLSPPSSPFLSTPLLDSFLLHAACVLSSRHGPTIPETIFRLILKLHPEQILIKDQTGSLPIHHILKPRGTQKKEERRKTTLTTTTNLQTSEVRSLPFSSLDNYYCYNDGHYEHHQQQPDNNDDKSNIQKEKEWKTVCQALIQQAPHTCSIPDGKGRLPLHLVLTSSSSSKEECDDKDFGNNKDFGDDNIYHQNDNSNIAATTMINKSDDSDDGTKTNHHQRYQQRKQQIIMSPGRAQIIKEIVNIYPEGIDKRDPVSGLFPFMQAALLCPAGDSTRNKNYDNNHCKLNNNALALDVVFCLLRRSPNVLTNSLSMQNNE